ncbi:MAG TPA: ComEA family DNA-binding protein [Dehalococcoidia bacterium]|nr:ComEA family DNA-binding protein [Dehalococcoidia bacterium]
MSDVWERLRVPLSIIVIVGLGMFASWKVQESGSLNAPGGTKITGSTATSGVAKAGVPTGTAAATATSRPQVIQVHVAGAVKSPGGSAPAADKRVKDAIAAAGGVVPEADEHQLNLAAPLQDGQRIAVPHRGEPAEAAPQPPGPASAAAASTGGPSPGGVLDLNRASAADLETLPGIGKVIAGNIVESREADGPFRTIIDLRDHKLIGPTVLERLRDRLTVQ